MCFRSLPRAAYRTAATLGIQWLFACLLLGCSPAEPTQPQHHNGSELPAAPERGVQLVTPEIVVAPFTEIMSCWYTTIDEGGDAWVTAMQSWQGESGHHVIGFVTDESAEEVPDGTVVDCIEPAAMARYVPIITPTLTPTEDNRFNIPEGLALKLPAGTRLVLQSHYINATSEQLRRRDVLNLWYSDPVDEAHSTAPWMVTSFDHTIPPGGLYTTSYDCPIEQTTSVYSIVGHMHEAGAEITVEGGPADDLKVLYHTAEWTPEYRDNPPQVKTPLDTSPTLTQGDILRVTCTWDPSEKDHPVTFPEEMCAALFWSYPAERPLFCASGAP